MNPRANPKMTVGMSNRSFRFVVVSDILDDVVGKAYGAMKAVLENQELNRKETKKHRLGYV